MLIGKPKFLNSISLTIMEMLLKLCSNKRSGPSTIESELLNSVNKKECLEEH
jgi:hypothetical protein